MRPNESAEADTLGQQCCRRSFGATNYWGYNNLSAVKIEFDSDKRNKTMAERGISMRKANGREIEKYAYYLG
jgi:hypothetical protein